MFPPGNFHVILLMSSDQQLARQCFTNQVMNIDTEILVNIMCLEGCPLARPPHTTCFVEAVVLDVVGGSLVEECRNVGNHLPTTKFAVGDLAQEFTSSLYNFAQFICTKLSSHQLTEAFTFWNIDQTSQCLLSKAREIRLEMHSSTQKVKTLAQERKMQTPERASPNSRKYL